MTEGNNSYLRRFNIIEWETELLYHRIALSFFLSDSAMNILYLIHHLGSPVLLSDIIRYSGLQKQTVSSSIRSLVKDGLITLSKIDGKKKNVAFTPRGQKTAENTVKRLIEWENDAISQFSDEEIGSCLSVMERYSERLRGRLADYEKEKEEKS